ncbi:hypothetical protein Pcinc_032186 [Petrolisthes cinctipes]|uniref:Uncharacterized protein n=1 Tax=Petrolisthes cinctipes TaxID=88211 RepID=A0AAE1K1X1_PETCI|nr:hypothetical protein Pcinc_032186 [Petrolisthes cinctipes]
MRLIKRGHNHGRGIPWPWSQQYNSSITDDRKSCLAITTQSLAPTLRGTWYTYQLVSLLFLVTVYTDTMGHMLCRAHHYTHRPLLVPFMGGGSLLLQTPDVLTADERQQKADRQVGLDL